METVGHLVRITKKWRKKKNIEYFANASFVDTNWHFFFFLLEQEV